MYEGPDNSCSFQQPKRRRASAQPVLGGAITKKAARPSQFTVIEESEPEEELPAKKVGRTKKLVRGLLIFGQFADYDAIPKSSAGAQGRKVSHLVRSFNYSS
jgi:hypothetical protein